MKKTKRKIKKQTKRYLNRHRKSRSPERKKIWDAHEDFRCINLKRYVQFYSVVSIFFIGFVILALYVMSISELSVISFGMSILILGCAVALLLYVLKTNHPFGLNKDKLLNHKGSCILYDESLELVINNKTVIIKLSEIAKYSFDTTSEIFKLKIKTKSGKTYRFYAGKFAPSQQDYRQLSTLHHYLFNYYQSHPLNSVTRQPSICRSEYSILAPIFISFGCFGMFIIIQAMLLAFLEISLVSFFTWYYCRKEDSEAGESKGVFVNEALRQTRLIV